jgi:hypothetical protein
MLTAAVEAVVLLGAFVLLRRLNRQHNRARDAALWSFAATFVGMALGGSSFQPDTALLLRAMASAGVVSASFAVAWRFGFEDA